MDEAKAREEERERMERNEVTEFSFLVEEDRRAEAERVERRVNAETRRAIAALDEAESRGGGSIPHNSPGTNFDIEDNMQDPE